jgi:nucleotide-binding universal stress UspA family protein
MYARILVPIDGSATAARGLQEAIQLAQAIGSRLRLVHVVNELILDPNLSAGFYSDTVIEHLRENGRRILDELAALPRKQGIETDTVLLEAIGGSAATLIIDEAKAWAADLIVMGTHGRRGLRRLAMGSDAEAVVRTAPVPVLLVHHVDRLA